MYRLRHSSRHRHWILLCGGIAVIALAAFGVSRLPRLFSPDTSLTQAHPVIHHISSGARAIQQVTMKLFTVALPAGWTSVKAPDVPYTVYSWQGSGDDADRHLDIDIDSPPADLAVNRLLPVQANGDRLTVTGTASDTCSNFTDKSLEMPSTGTAPAKWAGVNFICDMANYERDVVAIGVPNTINAVTLEGATTGAHRVLLVYTDNSGEPDYTVFSRIVQSFKVL